jgi:predicted nucleic acid-binding protein
MSSSIVTDASIWVSNLIPEDLFHSTSQGWLKSQHDQGVDLLAPAILITEVAGVIRRQTGKPTLAHKVVRTLKELPGLVLIEMSSTLVRQATELAADLGLRGADAYYVAVATYLQIPLATYDEDQLVRASAVLPSIIRPD